jgi:thiosulfate reductase cytochrome b subunit
MEGLSTEQIVTRLKNVMWPTLVANWVLWPAASLINFRSDRLPFKRTMRRIPHSLVADLFRFATSSTIL